MADTTLHGEPGPAAHDEGGTRRDFLYLLTGATAAVGVGGFAWALIDSMNPAADVLAVSTIEVDLAPTAVGQSLTVVWRSMPVFIRHRPEDQIEAAEDTPLDELPDPQTDQERVEKPEWLVVIGICTHLGCIPLGQNPNDDRGEYGGWFCPCHGSVYDTSGRIRQGPAPTNLVVPEYTFLDDTRIRIG